MALPLLAAFAGSSASGLAGSLLQTTLGSGMSALGGLVASTDKRAIPPPGAIFTALNRRDMPLAFARNLIQYHGIDWGETIGDIDTRWGSDAELGEPILDAPARQELWSRRRSSAWDMVRRSLQDRVGAEKIMELWARGWFATADDPDGWTGASIMLQRTGGDVDFFSRLRHTYKQQLDVGQILTLANRGFFGTNEQLARVGPESAKLSNYLKKLGYNSDTTRNELLSLREVLPGISDLVHFAVRDLWDKDVVDGRKLTEEFPHQLQGWANKLGLFGQSDATAGAENRRLTQAEMYWASHWQNVAAGQAYDMFHRLRPGRIDRFTAAPYNLDIKPFELADLRRALKIDDYAPGDRDYLTAIAFQPLQVRYVVKALGLREEVARDPALKELLPPATAASVDSYNREWAIEQFRDRGLHVDDAAAQADLAIVDAVKKTRAAVVSFERSVIGKSIRSALESYKQGAATRVDVKAHLLSQGVSEKYAEDALRTVEIEAHTAIVKSALSSVRHDYFSGVLAPSELLPALLQSGVQPEQAQWFAARWAQQRNRTRRTATTQQLLAWLKEGLIGQEEAHLRMLNLGWTEHDALIQLQGAAADVLKLQGKLLSAQNAQRTKAAKAAEKVAKDAKKVADTALKHARGQWTQAMLKSAFKKGVINADFVRQRLSAQGHDGLFIDVFLRDSVTSAKPKATSAAT